MTTGRINQVAIRFAEAVRDGHGDRLTDVRSPFRSSHESPDKCITTNIRPTVAAEEPPTDRAIYRTPSDHSFRGRNTQDRQGTHTVMLRDRRTFLDRRRPKATQLQHFRRTSQSDVSRPGTDFTATKGSMRLSGRLSTAVTTMAQPRQTDLHRIRVHRPPSTFCALTLTPSNI